MRRLRFWWSVKRECWRDTVGDYPTKHAVGVVEACRKCSDEQRRKHDEWLTNHIRESHRGDGQWYI